MECKGGPITRSVVAEENEMAKGVFGGWFSEMAEPFAAGNMEGGALACKTGLENAMATLSSDSLP